MALNVKGKTKYVCDTLVAKDPWALSMEMLFTVSLVCGDAVNLILTRTLLRYVGILRVTDYTSFELKQLDIPTVTQLMIGQFESPTSHCSPE